MAEHRRQVGKTGMRLAMTYIKLLRDLGFNDKEICEILEGVFNND